MSWIDVDGFGWMGVLDWIAYMAGLAWHGTVMDMWWVDFHGDIWSWI